MVKEYGIAPDTKIAGRKQDVQKNGLPKPVAGR